MNNNQLRVTLPDSDTLKIKTINSINDALRYILKIEDYRKINKDNLDLILSILNNIVKSKRTINIIETNDIFKLLTDLNDRLTPDVMDYIISKHKKGLIEDSVLYILATSTIKLYAKYMEFAISNFRYGDRRSAIKSIKYNKFLIYIIEMIFKNNKNSKLKKFIIDSLNSIDEKYYDNIQLYHDDKDNLEIFRNLQFIILNLEALILYNLDNKFVINIMNFGSDASMCYLETALINIIANMFAGSIVKKCDESNNFIYNKYNFYLNAYDDDFRTKSVINIFSYSLRTIDSKNYSNLSQIYYANKLFVTDEFKKYFKNIIDEDILNESYDTIVDRICECIVRYDNIALFKLIFSALSSSIFPDKSIAVYNDSKDDVLNTLVMKFIEYPKYINRLASNFKKSKSNYSNSSYKIYTMGIDVELGYEIIFKIKDEKNYPCKVNNKTKKKFENVIRSIFKKSL